MSECVIAVLTLAACVFAASASSKLRSGQAYGTFRAGLREALLVPGRLLPMTAAALAIWEAIAAVGLAGAAVAAALSGPGASALAESALAAAAVLMAVLVAGVAMVVRRGTRARCACFGASSGRPLGRAHLIRNACLLAVLTAGLVGNPLRYDRPAPAGVVLAVVVGAAVALLFVRWDDLVGLFAPVSPVSPVSPAGGVSPAGRVSPAGAVTSARSGHRPR